MEMLLSNMETIDVLFFCSRISHILRKSFTECLPYCSQHRHQFCFATKRDLTFTLSLFNKVDFPFG